MMSLISNYVFTEILQSLPVCLYPVIHRCLTLCVRVHVQKTSIPPVYDSNGTIIFSSDATIEFVLAFPNYPDISCVSSAVVRVLAFNGVTFHQAVQQGKCAIDCLKILSFSQLQEEITIYLLAQFSFEGVLLGCICDVIIKRGLQQVLTHDNTTVNIVNNNQTYYISASQYACILLREIFIFCPLIHNYCVTPKKIHLWLKRENSMLWTRMNQNCRLFIYILLR